MNHAVLVFTKVPKAGVSKTRLTEARGGIFTPEESNEFYEAALSDVISVCAASNVGNLYICCNREGDMDYFSTFLKKIPGHEKVLEVFQDCGGKFDDCMQYAADYILKGIHGNKLADAVTIVGGDLPTIQPHDLELSVQKLETLSKTKAGQKYIKDGIGAAIIESACQEGGFSIIGFTKATPFDFTGVFYNKDGITALDMVVEKATDKNIPLGIIEMVPDVDIMIDLAGMIPNARALEVAAKYDKSVIAPAHVLKFLNESGVTATSMPPAR